jgi:hypothetical protein
LLLGLQLPVLRFVINELSPKCSVLIENVVRILSLLPSPIMLLNEECSEKVTIAVPRLAIGNVGVNRSLVVVCPPSFPPSLPPWNIRRRLANFTPQFIQDGHSQIRGHTLVNLMRLGCEMM